MTQYDNRDGKAPWPGGNAALAAVAVRWAKKSFTFADVAAIGATTSGAIDFDEALPATAMVLGAYFDVTAAFNNAGDTATVTGDLGAKSGNTDAWVDGAALGTIAKTGATIGATPCGFFGGVTPTIPIASDVNCNTITKGAATAWVAYIEQPH